MEIKNCQRQYIINKINFLLEQITENLFGFYHEQYCLSWIMCIKGFVNRLSHNFHIDIDRDVSTAYYMSSSGDSVD